MPVRVAGNSAAGVTHFRSVVGNGITLGDFEPWNVADVLSPQSGLWSLSNGARYSAGRPIPRSQSLAKTIAFESSSHAGEKLLQFPPVTGIAGPPPTRRTQICFDPRVRPVYTIHFPSGETSESVVSVRAGGDCGTNFLVDRSNSMIFEVRPATSSNWMGHRDNELWDEMPLRQTVVHRFCLREAIEVHNALSRSIHIQGRSVQRPAMTSRLPPAGVRRAPSVDPAP